MTAPLDLALMVLAVLGAGALTLGEAVPVLHLPHYHGLKLWVRRVPLRAIALAAMGIGLRRLAEGVSAVAWHDFDAFLVRLPVSPVPAQPWTGDVLTVVAGLVLGGFALPPVVAATLGGFLAFALPSGWAALAWSLPLADGRAGHLFWVVAGVAAPAGLMGRLAWRRLGRPPEAESARALARLSTALRRGWPSLLAAAWVALAWHWQWVGIPVLMAATAGFLAAVVLFEAVAGDQPAGVAAVRLLGRGLIEQRRQAWLLAGGLACVGHWSLITAGTALVAHDGQRVLRQVADWPQLLTRTPDPDEASWEAVLERLEAVTGAYSSTPWSGQWLLIEAWIESTRLHHFHTATLLLQEARERYGQARATAPPGWRAGRTVGDIAERTLTDWGRIIDPGSVPG